MIAFAASLVLGVLLVFVIERWDSEYGFRSADEIQAALGVRALALVPDLSRRETQGVAAEDYILQKPTRPTPKPAAIRTGLFLTDGEHPPKTMLITSSVPLEGKSTIAASLARQSARSGLKVILIDADLRRPRLHEVIGLPNQNGLSEVLTGRANPSGDQARREVRARLPGGRRRRGQPAGPVPLVDDEDPARGDGRLLRPGDHRHAAVAAVSDSSPSPASSTSRST